MKAKMYLTILMFVPMFLFGQTTEPEFTGVKKAIGSNDPLIDYLSKNFICPNGSICLPEGTALVQFKVMPSGELSDFKVINSVCCLVDDELVRILKNTDGMWKPGKAADGESVPTIKEVSLMFVSSQHTDDPKEYFERNAKKNFLIGSKFMLEKKNLKKAIKYFDMSIKYRPREASTLMLRGLCRYELGDEEGAANDWKRIDDMGLANVDKYLDKLSEMSGYGEMTAIINE